MIYLKTEEEIGQIRLSNQLVAKTLAEVGKYIKPGVTTLQLDHIAEEFIRDNGGEPSFLGYNGFPNTLCTSVNDVVIHGIPNNVELKDGDIISVDCGACVNGFHGDSCFTFSVGPIKDNKVAALLKTTKAALYSGIRCAVEGRRLGDISSVIQKEVESNGFSIVREFTGHGVGRRLHEEPLVRNYGNEGSGIKLRRGMVIAIEPMVNMGKRNVTFDKDGWTVRTADHCPAAHFEHTVAVGIEKAEILSSFEFIETI